MVAQLAKRLSESNINIILTQSASWVNLTSVLQTLRVGIDSSFPSMDLNTIGIVLGKESSNCFCQF